MTARKPLQRPSSAWLRMLCMALFIAPVPTALVLVVLVVESTTLAGSVGHFEPLLTALHGCAIAAALYALVFVVVHHRFRRFRELEFSRGLPGSERVPGSAWTLGLLVFAMVALPGWFVCNTLNRTIGRVTIEPWHVANKHFATGRGCHFDVYLVRRQTIDAAHACVARERWQVLRLDDSLPVMTVISAFGEQVGLAPEKN